MLSSMNSSASIYEAISRLAAGHDAINLGQGYPDDPLDPTLVTDLAEAVRQGHNQYSSTRGVPEFREAITRTTRFFAGLCYDCETEVLATAGCTEALGAAVLGICPPDRPIVALDPHFNYYKSMAEMGRRAFKPVPLVHSAQRYLVDLNRLDSRLSEDPAVLILNSPHNPTGMVLSPQTLQAIAELCTRHDTIVISDEVYQHLNYEGPHRSIVEFDGMRERTVIVSSMSKLFSATGWRVGWAVGPAALLNRIADIHTNMSFCAPTPMQIAVAKALNRCLDGARFGQIRDEYAARRDVLFNGLVDAGFSPVRPQGAFFVVAAPPASLRAHHNIDLCKRMTTGAKVACLPMSVFSDSPEFRGLVRFSFCRNRDDLARAVKRLAGWFSSREQKAEVSALSNGV